MKISIITICYNRVSTIETAIQSVLSQTYPEIEYIVVDGGSTDGTQKVIEKYKDSISHYVSEPDKGMYNALNKAIGLATGDVIGILHSDDEYFSNETLAIYADTFLQSNVDIVYANGMYFSESKEQRTKNKDHRPQTTDHRRQSTDKGEDIVKRIYKAKPFKKWYLYFGWIPLHTTIFVKREVFENYGLYKENYQIASDYEISLRWFLNPALKKQFTDTWVVRMKLGGKSTSASLQKKKSAEDLEIIRYYKLWGVITLMFKIGRKIPQYLLPRIFSYR